MSAPRTLFFICVAVYAFAAAFATTVHESYPVQKDDFSKKIELYDGVSVKIPIETNSTGRLFSIELDTKNGVEEGRKKQKNLMQRILPLFIMPFLIQSAIVPLFLSMLKFMLFKALMIGKLAMGFIILNAFRNHSVPKGRDAEMAEVHYGYHGNDEYGAYINH